MENILAEIPCFHRLGNHIIGKIVKYVARDRCDTIARFLSKGSSKYDRLLKFPFPDDLSCYSKCDPSMIGGYSSEAIINYDYSGDKYIKSSDVIFTCDPNRGTRHVTLSLILNTVDHQYAYVYRDLYFDEQRMAILHEGNITHEVNINSDIAKVIEFGGSISLKKTTNKETKEIIYLLSRRIPYCHNLKVCKVRNYNGDIMMRMYMCVTYT